MSARGYPRSLCESDVVFFINTFCRLYDPRRGLGSFPFEMSSRQSDFAIAFDSAIGKKDLAVVKQKRDVGATWLSAAVLLRRWLLREGENFLVLERTSSYDVFETTNSFLSKFNYLLRLLPGWLRPESTERARDLFLNKDTGTQIVCGSIIGESFLGERFSSILLDDFDPLFGKSAKVFNDIQTSTNSRVTISQGAKSFLL